VAHFSPDRSCRRDEPRQHAGKQREDEADQDPCMTQARVGRRLMQAAPADPAPTTM